MAFSDLQIGQLSESHTFQQRVAGSIMVKASYIVDHTRSFGTIEEPIQGQVPVFTIAQLRRAISLMRLETPLVNYYLPMAASGNIRTSNPVLDGSGVAVDCSADDAALDSQMFTTVFQTIL